MARAPREHGTTAMYYTEKCRCEDCRQAAREYRESRKHLRLEPDDPRHGTPNGYSNWRCRCDLCKAAVLVDRKRTRAQGLPDGDERHGTVSGYTNWGCRCRECTDAAVAQGEPNRKKNALWFHYRMTEEDWERMWASQGQACAVCRRSKTDEDKRSFHIDHSHSCCPGPRSCGECVRAILCHGCNVALGLVQDSPHRLRALADYLESHGVYF